MNTAIFYDSETTGIPIWSEPSEHPSQPHIVQLAAILVDLDTKKDLQCIDLIIRPDGWEITKEMTEIHGITHEMAMDLGVSEKTAASMLIELSNGFTRIAHNESFDARIIRIATKRYLGEEVAEKWKQGIGECTARLSRPICGLHKSKIPTLTEAYTHFYGQPHKAAHTAIGDVVACRDVYFAVKHQKQAA